MRNKVEFTYHPGMGESPEDLSGDVIEKEESSSGTDEAGVAETVIIEVWKAQLDEFCPTTGVIYLQADCHPEKTFTVSYHKLDGTVAVWCAACDGAVATFKIL